MKEFLNYVVAHRGGALAVLCVAALLETFGDSCFQAGLYRSSGMARAISLAGGALALACYGLAVNTPRWEFGELLGVYVALFFLFAQILAKTRFKQPPTPPILLGGSLIALGGIIITFWRN